jgi:hypothetical protein
VRLNGAIEGGERRAQDGGACAMKLRSSAWSPGRRMRAWTLVRKECDALAERRQHAPSLMIEPRDQPFAGEAPQVVSHLREEYDVPSSERSIATAPKKLTSNCAR